MLLLSRLIGQPVRASDGGVAGRLFDVSVRLLTEPHVLEQFVVRRAHARTLVVPWTDVVVNGGQLALTDGDLSRY